MPVRSPIRVGGMVRGGSRPGPAEPYEAGIAADRRRTRRWFAVITVGVLAAAGGIAYGIAVALSGPHHRPHPTSLSTGSSTTGASTSAPSAATTAPPGSTAAGGLALERPARLVNGVGQGWSHTTVGAVSAAVNYSQALLSTSNEGQVDAMIPLIVVPANVSSSIQALSAQFAHESARARSESVTTRILDYSLAACTSTRCEVWLLGTEILTLDNGQVQTTTLDGGVVVVWQNGDWKLITATAQPPGTAPPTADPGTPAAIAKGWKPLAV